MSHPFYTRLNRLLREHGFDDFAEAQCATFYAETMGRPGLPSGNTRAARRVPKDLWRIVQRKLKLLDAAGRLDDLVAPAGNRLERLKGNQAGRHSIRVNEQYRVTFRWENGHAYEVRVEDYH